MRGSGLFVSVELVRDRESLEPAIEEAHAVVDAMREDGALVGVEGVYGNILEIRPRLVFGQANAEQLSPALDRALESI